MVFALVARQWSMTYHRICCVLLGEATNVTTRHTQDHGEVRGEGNTKAVAHEPCPNLGRISFPDHYGADQCDREIPGHEVGACVL